ncbi:MAG: hypothetical protein IKV57_02570 [Clostridia bacterium]|nr:hypothetical protein [Clostridia bacterium]
MRWTSWLLTMAMVVTMLPGLSMLASAAEEEQHADVVAWNDTDNDGVIDEGETTYETLNTALNAGGTVKLYKDYEASDEGDILVAKDTEETLVVTLDLNGKTLSSTSGYFLDLYNTNFTITNTSEETGKIESLYTNTTAIFLNNKTTSLKIDGNIIISSSSSGYALQGYGGILEINDGVFSGAVNIDVAFVSTTITGGTFENFAVGEGAPLTITGGTFNIDPTAWLAEGYEAVKNEETGMWVVSEITAEPEAAVEFIGASIFLEGNIGLNFFCTIDETVFDDTTIILTMADGRTFAYPASQGVKDTSLLADTTLYGFKAEVYAKQMSDAVKAVAEVNGEVVAEMEYSVCDYAEVIIANPDTYETYIPMVKAMLNYGAAAQVQFGYNTDDLANEQLSDADKQAVNDVADEVFQEHRISPFSVPGMGTFVGADLVLESETTLNVYFMPEEGVDVSTLTFYVGENVVKPVNAGSYCLIPISDILASNLDKEYSVVVTNGTETVTMALSAFSYCAVVMEQEENATYTAALKNVLRALYLYNAEANALYD